MRVAWPLLIIVGVAMVGLAGCQSSRPDVKEALATEVAARRSAQAQARDLYEKALRHYGSGEVDAATRLLEQAVDRARRRIEAGRPSAAVGLQLNDQLEQIVKMMAGRQVRRDQVAIKVGERFMLVQAEEIIFASLADESITIVTGQVAGTSNYRTLDDLQARLDPEVFWRVHRSHLVNINKIKEIVPWFSRNYILRMKDAKGTEIPVSRAQTKRLREYLKL